MSKAQKPLQKKALLLRGVLAGYGALVLNILYSLLSIPLILSYVDLETYGLWSVVISITGYLNLAELGISNALQRHLIQYKDTRENGLYGATLVMGAIAFAIIALICLVIGAGASLFIGYIIKVPSQLSGDFIYLLWGSVALFSIGMSTRILGMPLVVYQRSDLWELSNGILFVIWFATLWISLKFGAGVYALLINSAIGILWMICFNMFTCLSQGLYPSRKEIGPICWKDFRQILSFSRDVFLMQSGSQIAAALPILIIPRYLGLESVAIWNICTRAYTIAQQFLTRPFQTGIFMLNELYTREGSGEKNVMRRWTDLTQITMAVSVVILSNVAIFNSYFIEVWMKGKVSWSIQSDLLYSLSIQSAVISICIIWMAGINLKFGFMRFTALAEAGLLLLLSLIAAPVWGLSGVIVAIIASRTVCGTIPGVVYLSNVFNINPIHVVVNRAFRPLLFYPVTLAISYLCSYLMKMFDNAALLLVSGSLSILMCGLLVFRFGIDASLRHETLGMLKKRFGVS